MKKIISILTATRAEYGLLHPIIKKLNQIDDYDVRVVVTGMHLSAEYGYTYKEIEYDGIKIDKKIEILLNSGSSVSVSKSMGLAIISFAEYFDNLKPDLLIVLGDRYETLAVCCAAMNANIPIAHLYGGETTEGAIDEAIRHSITKMSYLHFTSTESYRKRVIQLGEDPERVFNVGSLGVENIKNIKLLTKEELEKSIHFSLDKRTALMTFHPVTLEKDTCEAQFKNILDAIDSFDDLKVIITKANADMGGILINKMIDDYVASKPEKCIAYESLGQVRYLSAMKHCDFVIGNSSSGIIEAPSLKKIVINIGDRQKGRIQAKSTINCKPEVSDIILSIRKALSIEYQNIAKDVVNPYGEENVSDKIIYEINNFFNRKVVSLSKKFYDL